MLGLSFAPYFSGCLVGASTWSRLLLEEPRSQDGTYSNHLGTLRKESIGPSQVRHSAIVRTREVILF